MKPSPEKQCSVVYEGKSYPQFHGTRCTKEAPHPDEQHYGTTEGHWIRWRTAAEKQIRRAG
jgi:hypothetical protein